LFISDFNHVHTSAFRRRNSSSLASHPSRFEQLPNNITIPVQFRTENWQLRTENCFSAPSKFYGQAERAISTGKLRVLPLFHLQPINQVVFLGPSYPLRVGRSHLEECFPLICIQRLSLPNFATERCHWHDSSNTRGSSIPVLSY
jgi:hypothetical protein